MPAAFGKDDARHGLAVSPRALQLLQHTRGVGQAKGLESAIGQHAAPAVKQHHGLRTGSDLFVQVQSDAVGIDGEDAVQQIRSGVEQLLDGVVIGAAAALDHVASQRPGAARKADERRAALQGVARAARGIKYIAQAFHIGHGQTGHIVFVPYGVGELRAFALLKRQAQPHGIGHRQNVAEQNGGIQRVTLQRLQRGFGRQLRVACQRHEAACLRAQGAVFGQVTPGLAHEPHRGVICWQTLAGAQEGVVAQRGKRRSAGFCHGARPLLKRCHGLHPMAAAGGGCRSIQVHGQGKGGCNHYCLIWSSNLKPAIHNAPK